MKILFKNADILVKDGNFGVLSNAFLAVDGDKISYIGTNEPSGKFNETKDMSGKMLMPGLINCHNHCPMVLLRELAAIFRFSNGSLTRFFRLRTGSLPRR